MHIHSWILLRWSDNCLVNWIIRTCSSINLQQSIFFISLSVRQPKMKTLYIEAFEIVILFCISMWDWAQETKLKLELNLLFKKLSWCNLNCGGKIPTYSPIYWHFSSNFKFTSSFMISSNFHLESKIKNFERFLKSTWSIHF